MLINKISFYKFPLKDRSSTKLTALETYKFVQNVHFRQDGFQGAIVYTWSAGKKFKVAVPCVVKLLPFLIFFWLQSNLVIDEGMKIKSYEYEGCMF